MLTVNLLAALATALLLIGATLAIVQTRKLPFPTIDVFAFVGYAIGLILGIGVCILLRRLTRSSTSRIVIVLIAIFGLSALYWMPALQISEISFGASLAIAVGLGVGATTVLVWTLLSTGTSANVINLITSISAFGLGVGAAAVLLVLSVFNGFEEVIGDMFGKFNAAVKVIPARGKTFDTDSIPLDILHGWDGVEALSLTLEETAFFEYGDSRAFGTIKGVDDVFTAVSGVDSTIIEGSFETKSPSRSLAVLGIGLRNKLNVNVGNGFDPIQVYAAKRKTRGPLDKPFRVKAVFPQGSFAIQQDYDQEYLFTNLEAVQTLLGLPNAASAIEIEIKNGFDASVIADNIEAVLGDQFVVMDRLEQDADLLRLMNIEKWLSYVILSLVLLLISFNLIGGLWLIVLEKQRDIGILRAMGIEKSEVKQIFLGVGFLLSMLGILIGTALAGLLYFLQVQFELITVPQGLVVSAYPIEMRSFDFLIVVLTVLLIGFLASLPAARRAGQIDSVS